MEKKLLCKQVHLLFAAITSCTNTSNPHVMLGAGLLAKKAYELGIEVPAYVKTSLAPGSTVVTRYLDDSGLSEYLDKLGFNTRSEEHTSELQSRGHLVCRLLLEKKKQYNKSHKK